MKYVAKKDLEAWVKGARSSRDTARRKSIAQLVTMNLVTIKYDERSGRGVAYPTATGSHQLKGFGISGSLARSFEF